MPVLPTLNLLNSARAHKVFQNFEGTSKKQISQKLIISAEESRQDVSNGVWFAHVNFYKIWVLRQGEK